MATGDVRDCRPARVTLTVAEALTVAVPVAALLTIDRALAAAFVATLPHVPPVMLARRGR